MSRRMDHRAAHHRTRPHAASHEAFAAASLSFNKNAPLREQARQIRWLLQEQGAGYSCLLLYLSSRIDLLPAEFCREFSFTPDSRPALSAVQVHKMLEEELSPSLKRTLVEFNSSPSRCSLLTQSHHARLANGSPVTVTMLRPECFGLGNESQVPSFFDKAMVQEYCGHSMDDAVFLDFFTSLHRKCDFATQMEILEGMARDNAGVKILSSLKIYPELSNTRIITMQQVEGLPLEEAASHHTCNKEVLARSLCQAWLHQALCTNGFAVDAHARNIMVVNNALLFEGCEFARISAESRENLWNYLMATMVDDPDKAAMYLLREMFPSQRRVDLQAFRSRFRQSAYFGALEPLLGTNSNTLAQLIFQHWKTALEYGYIPKSELLCFYRGLFSSATTAQSLSPFTDPLRQGIEEVRSDRIAGQFKEMFDLQYWFQNSEKLATALATLPRIMDDALTQASVPDHFGPTQEQHRADKSSGRTSVIVICLLLTLMVLLRSPNGSPSADWPFLLLLMVSGFMVLKKITD